MASPEPQFRSGSVRCRRFQIERLDLGSGRLMKMLYQVQYLTCVSHFHVLARKGLMSFHPETKWGECAAAYRMRLFVGGGAAHLSGKVVLDKEKIKEVLAQGGELSLGQVLRLRVRHMSDGVALGTRAFVKEVFVRHREKFGPKRKSGARPIRALASIGLNALRDLRVRAFG
jgi:hypothetical protein